MLSPDEILKLPTEARRRLRLVGVSNSKRERLLRQRRKALKQKRQYRGLCKLSTKEEIVDFLRDNNIKTLKDLQDARKNGAPPVSLILKFFESWKQAKAKVWGDDALILGHKYSWKKNLNAEYFMKCVFEFDLWTFSAYKKASLLYHDVIPPLKVLYREWGSFRNLIECCRRKRIAEIIREYARVVVIKKGVFPTVVEARRLGLRIGEAVTLFGGKRQFDKFVGDLIAGRAL